MKITGKPISLSKIPSFSSQKKGRRHLTFTLMSGLYRNSPEEGLRKFSLEAI
jgi:hypothetical protein